MTGSEPSAPVIRIDPTTGRPILMAPARQARPILTAGTGAPQACPFCPGQEAQTPPEVMAIRPEGGAPDSPGWTVRAFPNLYPAAACHEVVAEGAEHQEQPSRIPKQLWPQVLEVWNARIAAIEARPGAAFAYWFKNVGREAGASIAHNHSQILGLPELPPRLQLEQKALAALDHCPFCRAAETAERTGTLVHGDTHHLVLCPDPPKLPFETWLLPRACESDFAATEVESLARSLHALFTAIDRAFGAPPFNCWLHRIPGAAFHWHLELQPRTGFLAGLELGGDMYINSVPAEQAAAKLRAALSGAGTS